MKKLLASLLAIAGMASFAVAIDWNDFAEPVPEPKTAIPGNIPADTEMMTNTQAVVEGLAKNLQTEKVEREAMITTENADLVKVIRDVLLDGDYVWDEKTKILYLRKIDNKRLYYIAVTNVNLIQQGKLVNSQMPKEEK